MPARQMSVDRWIRNTRIAYWCLHSYYGDRLDLADWFELGDETASRVYSEDYTSSGEDDVAQDNSPPMSPATSLALTRAQVLLVRARACLAISIQSRIEPRPAVPQRTTAQEEIERPQPPGPPHSSIYQESADEDPPQGLTNMLRSAQQVIRLHFTARTIIEELDSLDWIFSGRLVSTLRTICGGAFLLSRIFRGRLDGRQLTPSTDTLSDHDVEPWLWDVRQSMGMLLIILRMESRWIQEGPEARLTISNTLLGLLGDLELLQMRIITLLLPLQLW